MERVQQVNSHLAATTVIQEQTEKCCHLTLNRPSALNSLNSEMLRQLHSIVESCRKSILLITGEGRAFCAGGDVLAIAKQPEIAPLFFSAEFSLFYRISQLPCMTMSIMNGIVMGGGVGLAQSCRIKLATEKTLWAMPETAIGFTPDVGATYFLTRVQPQEIGLFLGLTGTRLNGADCYYFRLADYYMKSERVPSLIEEIQSGADPYTTCAKYHSAPENDEYQLVKHIQEIRQVFNLTVGVEGTLSALEASHTPWAQGTLKTIRELCPLSLQITYESFKRGLLSSYRECLISEYDLVMQMTLHRNENFMRGITSRLIEKNKGKIKWVPETICEVPPQLIQPYFNNTEGPWLDLDNF